MRKKLTNFLGFSLLEALVAVTILGIIGFILADVMIRSFKSTTRTQNISLLKQNGQSAINSIVQTLRTADKVVCVIPNPTSGDILTIQTKSGNYVRFVYTTVGSPPIGYIAQDNPAVSNPSFDPNHTNNMCDISSGAEFPWLSTNLTYLTDKTAVNVQKTTDIFTISSSPGFKDTITVQFVVGPALDSQNQEVTVPFQTTVQIR